MKSKIIAVALFILTAATVIAYPSLRSNGAIPRPPPPQAHLLPENRPKIEVVFALDTTGSMGGLIQAAKEKIWSIATTMASAQTAPEISIGLVAYRDRGDAYVTKVVDLSTDLDSVYATLMDFEADGGGDGPESVNQALYEAVNGVSWSQDPQSYKVVFLVGDAPPHMDYQDDVKYPATLSAAKDKGIVVNTIQCGDMAVTTGPWQRIAELGHGSYFEVEQAGSAVALATPFDADIASLSAELDGTRLYYGSEEEKAKMDRKREATTKLHAFSSVEVRARRGAFNASESGRKNLLGESELVDDVASGRVDLAEIENERLPQPMQSMSPEKQRTLIEETADKRSTLTRQIKELAQKRSEFLAEEVKKAGGARDSLDHQIYSTIRDQAAAKGLEYDRGPEY